ncbi:hypothetical protein E2562_038854 [Oryza meyeriana var. granulata]|uniref:UDP-glycosyltransferases domain-containing protein n=1 Tax=Oryza meyeriana var. granulata TaxID=110450 RepID=A0A6G1DTH5_9ORYZ|nr:hypothetical protein E2562_038854 [Oryza meyeriana var. granulata]
MAPQPHVMVLPFPAQGHVMPLMELSHRLVDLGFEVDFVHTDFNRDRVLKAMADETGATSDGIHMVSFPDGMDPAGDRADIAKLAEGLPAAMLGGIEEMIRSKGIRWVIADVSMTWVMELAATVGIHVALFSTYSAAVVALRQHVPKLLEDGILDENGNVKRNEMIWLSPTMPPVQTTELPWVTLSSTVDRRRMIIQNVFKTNPTISSAEVIICNTFQDVEPGALALLPNVLPVGPLKAPATSSSAGHFWPEDLTCLAWLNEQDACSVIYVAFGSFTVFDMARVQELADGLVLTGRPFLWVIRQNFTKDVGEGWLEEFRRHVSGKGMIVGWAPQQQVLSHPSVACFVSHCGWNSTMEGLQHGVPFLCWPYFADQYCNQSYICNVWGTGVKLQANERGVVTKEEIKNKVKQLLDDKEIKARAAKWKDTACASIAEGGSSHKNLLKFLLVVIDLSRKIAFMAPATQPHVMVLPFPAQGHVIPLMKLSHRLVERGFKIDFVNTEFNHDRVLKALAEKGTIPGGIHMLAISDGLGPADDHTDIGNLVQVLPATMLSPLEKMIRSKKIKWVIVDVSMSWALELATTVGVRIALFSTYSAAAFALRMNLPKLIEDGILDETGNVKRHEMVQLMPPIDAAEIPWVSLGSTKERRRFNIQNVFKTNRLMELAEMIICNTFWEIESEALALSNALPVGPLVALASGPTGNFLPEDLTSLTWLDTHTPSSVIYVAFGSSTIFDVAQFHELANGLALSGQPFLWVVQPNFTNGIQEDWFNEYKDRVEGKGLVISWAPQQRVLSHPSIACFISHCGWNSTMEGIKLCRDKSGIVAQEEIKNKVAQLLGDEEIKERATTLKATACASIRDGGSSHQNFLKLVNLLKEQ